MKKFLSLLLCITMIFVFTACGGNDPTVDIPEDDSSKVSSNTEKIVLNPLTGLKDLEREKQNLRPVAVMINNLRGAQAVQTGVTKADIVYEMEVEGGITRLLAVFKDISRVEQLGSVRSARYDYIDLAMGHDAIYVHCGIDMTYAQPHLEESGATSFNINSSPWASYGFRESNGLASEHTMYTNSSKLKQGFEALSVKTTTEKINTFCEFNENGTVVTPKGDSAYTVSVPFSNASVSVFKYNPETHRYTKNTKGTTNKDYKTGEAYEVTNVFVLETSVGDFADGYHRDISLTGGKGYYISDGACQEIIWKKGVANESIKYYNTDNTPLKINAGKSWVCIQNDSFDTVIEGAPQ